MVDRLPSHLGHVSRLYFTNFPLCYFDTYGRSFILGILYIAFILVFDRLLIVCRTVLHVLSDVLVTAEQGRTSVGRDRSLPSRTVYLSDVLVTAEQNRTPVGRDESLPDETGCLSAVMSHCRAVQ